jgi:histidyl-tRNA synthetase
MPAPPRTFLQGPKGTRDFYPPDMAVRRHIESVWRGVSVRHGFEEIDGPTFEHLDLYTVKSGPGIVSEIFSFRRAGGDRDYALRPEFTPTLARMFAAQAGALPRPTRWFMIGPFFRAERPQRGRLREHVQWNVDVIGDATPAADAEVVAAAVAALERLGLTPRDVRVRASDRRAAAGVLRRCGVAEDHLTDAFEVLDRRDRTPPQEFARRCADLSLDAAAFDAATEAARGVWSGSWAACGPEFEPARELGALLAEAAVSEWCDFDLGVVRGLAYYSGSVFEVHEAGGRERAIAGGGRYDNLVELVGGPPTPAVGIAMGDVVIRLVLEERGLLEPPQRYQPRPDAFLIAADDEAQRSLPAIAARLRRAGLHVRHGPRGARNVGRLLGQASRAGARFAVILGEELRRDSVVVRDLDAATQREVAAADLVAVLGSPA